MGAFLYSPNTTYNTTSASSTPSSPSLANATYSDMLLEHAVTLYRVGNSTLPYTTFATSIPAVASAYGSTVWSDKMAIAALTLALATGNSTYYADAYRQYQSYVLTGSTRPWNWDSRYPALYVLFTEISVARPGLAAGAGLDANVTGWQTECEHYFDRMIKGDLGDSYLTSGE
jgi:endoglucanase